MKPYPRYKPTGLAWLPSVPEHWEMVKNRSFLYESKAVSSQGDAQLLSVSQYDGVTLFSEDRKERVSSLEGYKLVEKDDLVINIMLAWNGSSGVSAFKGVVSPAYAVFKFRGSANPRYAHYLFRSIPFRDYFKAYSTGVVDSRLRLYPQVLAQLWSPLPPPDEQTRIVQYLDEKTAAIDELLRAKERQIELLRERKQALVSAAVTGRETSSASSALPSGWRRCRLKELVRFFKGLNITKADLLPEGAAVISYGQIHAKDNDGLSLKDAHLRFVSPSLADPSAMLQFGDVVFADTSEDESGIGNCVLNNRTDSVWAGYHTIVARFRDPSQARFLAALFQSDWWRDQIRRGANGVKVFSVTQRLLANTTVLLPPLPEQRQIVAHLDSVCADFAAAETAIRKQITLLQELRTRLVSDAVTGAVEVP